MAKRAFFQPVAPRAVLFHNFPEHLYSSRQLLINPSSAQNSKLKHLNEVINQINPIEVHIRLLAPSPPHFQLALSNSPSPHFQLAPFHLRFCIILCDIFTNWFFSLVLFSMVFLRKLKLAFQLVGQSHDHYFSQGFPGFDVTRLFGECFK